MIRNLTADRGFPYEWIDVINPSLEEMEQLAEQYKLHEASVDDCMQPGHLPKYEQFKNYTFVIFRVYAESEKDADTVRGLTDKLAIFITDKYIMTVHNRSMPQLDHISDVLLEENECEMPLHVLIEIVLAGLHTYDEPAQKISQLIDYYEAQVFLTTRKVPLLKGIYFIKRKLDVIRRMLLLIYDIVDKIDYTGSSNAFTRDVRDLYVKQKSLYDSMSDNTNQLLNIYFNISSQRTNETMRILTIFSVFFLPLTFIVGLYGMNFSFMPELTWRYGYPFVIILMVTVIILTYLYFKKKKWM